MTLAELQKRVGAAIMAPLARHDEISTEWRGEADELVKPNDRLTSLERLEIYSRSYWFRVIDCLYDDFPGLAAALGPRAFDKLVRAYLADRPSQSFTLRNLGEGLEAWLRVHPEYAGKHFDLAIDMIRLEWAHIEAFDGEERKPLGPEDLLEPGPVSRSACSRTSRCSSWVTRWMICASKPINGRRNARARATRQVTIG
jgi:hypothetical protein